MTAAVLERSRPTSAARSSARAATGTRTQTRTRPQTATRPKLKVLNQEAIRQRARRRNALLMLFIVVLLGFFAVAFVHAQLVAGQQDLDSVRSRIAEAEAHRAKVARLVEEASSPEVIVTRATEELGMVRAFQPVYLEAVSPVRELPTVATYVPSGPPEHLDVAAGVSSSASGISAGISASTDVLVGVETGNDQLEAAGSVSGPVSVETPAVAPSTAVSNAPTVASVSAQSQSQVLPQAQAETQPQVATQVQTQAQVQTQPAVEVSTGGAFGGVSVTTSNASPSAPAQSGFQGASTSNQQTGSSFAGSRAVSGGQGSG